MKLEKLCLPTLCLVLWIAAGCSSPTAPTVSEPPVSSPAPFVPPPVVAATSETRGGSLTISVTDGWTGAPVSGARVVANGVESVTASNGTLELTVGSACLPLDIIAPGFLQRRTCAKSSITLWPIADAAEEAATRQAAFPFRDQLTDQVAYAKEYGVMFGTALSGRTDVLAAWNEAADIIRANTSGRLSIPFVKSLPDEGYLVSVADVPPQCRHGSFTWTFCCCRLLLGTDEPVFPHQRHCCA